MKNHPFMTFEPGKKLPSISQAKRGIKKYTYYLPSSVIRKAKGFKFSL